MQPVNFACPHCGNLMAVGAELLGQSVRCPHCQQVITAPMPSIPAAQAVKSIQSKVPSLSEINFTIKPEDTDSIMSMVIESEDLFGAVDTKKPVLPPAPSPLEAAGLIPSDSIPLMSLPPEFQQLPASDQFFSNAVQPEPLPPVYEPPPELPPPESIPADPFGTSPLEAPPPPMLHTTAPPRREPPAKRNWAGLALAVLGPYALLMTIVSGTLALKTTKNTHPLEALPDYIGDNQGKTTKGRPTSLKDLKLPKADGELPKEQHVKLGQSLTLNDLQVKPERVSRAPAKKIGGTEVRGAKDNLLLTLRLRNVSTDTTFYPTDRAFDRRYDDSDRGKVSPPFTLLEAGSRKFFGGPLGWSEKDGAKDALVGQEHDGEPLDPGQERTTLVCLHSEHASDVLNSKQKQFTWRVHLRTGTTRVRGKDVACASVFGVDFGASDIQRQ